MAGDFILYEKSGPIVRLTFNRPEKLNAIPYEETETLTKKIREIEEDDEVKVIILRGKGRAFSSGGDMNWIGAQYYGKERRPSQRSRLRIDRGLVEHEKALFYCSKVTIAQVHGWVAGGAFRMMLCCDMTIAAEGTKLFYSEPRMIPGFAMSLPMFLLKVGPAYAQSILFTGRTITAEEGERHGFITKVVPQDQLEAEVEKWAQAVSLLQADGIAIGKRQLHMAYDMMGVGLGYNFGSFAHVLHVQQHLDPGEWNIFKAREAGGGGKGAYKTRDERFPGL